MRPAPAPLRPIPYPSDADYTRQSFEVPNTRKPGQTGHYRNGAFPFLTLESPGAYVNLVEVFDSGRKTVPSSYPLLGRRPLVSTNPPTYAKHYEWISWEEVDIRRQHIGSGISQLFDDGIVGGGSMKSFGIYSGNCPEWELVDLAAHAYELVTVPLYDTLGKDTVEYILNHTESTLVVVAPQHVATILKLAPRLPAMKCIISMDTLSYESKRIYEEWGAEVGIKIYDLAQVEAIGKAHLKPLVYPEPHALATICYTSGTTGNPKGVPATHGMISNALYAQAHGYNDTHIPVAISFLPLAHAYGRMAGLTVIAQGGCLGFWSGDPVRLLEDMQILKPTFFPAVPRVLNRIHQAGMAAAALPGVKGALFRRALEAKLQRLRTTGQLTHPLWDRLVFKKIAAVLGGNVKVISTGSAPMSPAAMDFLKVAIGAEVLEGVYGSTENFGIAAKIWWGDKTGPGRVGAPQANTELKLVDVPSMGYFSTDVPYPRGEICMRGDHCFKEYYKDPENTKATIDNEGWQHSGDVGEIDECGRLRIIDRVKNIMKLAQGEYVALERVESLYSACPIVAQLYVHGDSLQSYLIGLVFPDPVQLAAIAARVWAAPVSSQDAPALNKAARDTKVQEEILKALNKQARTAGLNGFETLKRIYVSNDMCTVDNNCLTPTLKMKRKEIYAKFKQQLDDLYALGEPGKTVPRL
ncbi:hypothetical protein PHLGIDRAFT_89325 [Phlebiopsis gigantea 11061_1 CR5-6]|uniref:AMP-dependent synthetase/ligase domain-containing protein n=1 Tax=Phlebiopsis gigantea (strain 11061_1 CR5-6) TaxID=745531 RepID=A0A0C3NQW7_PHLG1|nr:hypothetical protein PHLGIDRAFT_89325 [Phlebiopsis gigantea 11061_1 CR5-6]